MWKRTLLDWAGKLEHPAWGFIHSERVYRLTLHLAAEEGLTVDEDALFAAAYLHDAGAIEPYRLEGVDHAVRSAEMAAEVLPDFGFPREKAPLVVEIIRGHMYDAEPGQSHEAILFHDADALDFLGVIGIARLLAVTGRDSWTPDLNHSIAVIKGFSRDLPSSLRTTAARKIGEARRREMDSFLSALSVETDGLRLL